MPRMGFKTALVLSGGSARALAHLGVLEALQEHGIRVDMVVGTSMGAIIGGLYAYYGDVAPVVARMRNLVENELFLRAASAAMEDTPENANHGFLNRFMWLFRRGVYYTHSMIRPNLVTEESYWEIISDLMPDQPIEKLSIPFASVAMDLLNGEEIVLGKGSLRKAVAASAAIPGILPPVEIRGRVLVDGGWVDNVPVAPAIAMGAHLVVASDACLDIPYLGPLPTSAIESLFRCNEITRITLNRHRGGHADVKIVPEIGPLSWANFSEIDRCLSAGRAALKAKLKHIRRGRRVRRCTTMMGLIHPGRRSNWRHPFVMY
jgi:NTE family protein